ncbi:MAG: hypothetical protein M3Q07_23770 [Pseudobdellovibrionaceae bacterium]|nr:hypothetical protein [Pseudobdellovibrionaceae bacterium]
MAAGALLVEEAGGIIRNFNNSTGTRYDLEQGDIICGTPSVVQLISGLI